MRYATAALRSLGTVFATAGRLLARHWPQLVALFLAGAVLRLAILYAAAVVSNWSPTVAVLLVPLAPLAMLLAIVLMLRVVGSDLAAFRDQFTRRGGARVRADLQIAGEVLIPFLAVYAAQGMLKADVRQFIFDTTLDDSISKVIPSYGRAIVASGWLLVAIVVIALVARKIIAGYDLVKKGWGFAALGGYLEALWMVTLGAAFTTGLKTIQEWVLSRQLVASALDGVGRLLAWAGPAGRAIAGVYDALVTAIGGLGAIVVLPVAWLAIGAAIYGTKIDGRALPNHESVTRRIKRIPSPVRRTVAQVAEPVTTPVSSTLSAIRKIAVAGIAPMLLFCFAFVLAGLVKVLVALGLRAAIGPQEALLRAALQPYVATIENLVYVVLAVALLAAAVNFVVLAEERSAAEPADADAPVSQPVPATA